MQNYYQWVEKVSEEIKEVLKQVSAKEVEELCGEILKAEKVFLFGAGRTFLALKSMGKRLGHLGINAQIVGSVTEMPITLRDLLLIASGSGESRLPLEIARIAKSLGARIGLITASRQSSIKSIADFSLTLACPQKTNWKQGVKSIQPMASLFEQSLFILGDIIALMLMKKKGLQSEDLWKRHANLE